MSTIYHCDPANILGSLTVMFVRVLEIARHTQETTRYHTGFIYPSIPESSEERHNRSHSTGREDAGGREIESLDRGTVSAGDDMLQIWSRLGLEYSHQNRQSS
jgi:hypothetical protein